MNARRYIVGMIDGRFSRPATLVFAESPDEIPAIVAEQEGPKWEVVVALPWEPGAPEPRIDAEDLWRD